VAAPIDEHGSRLSIIESIVAAVLMYATLYGVEHLFSRRVSAYLGLSLIVILIVIYAWPKRRFRQE
jgi:hypothetical protein